MIPNFELNIQVAIVERLLSYAPLADLVGESVFDVPPQIDDTKFGASYPYIVVGEDTFVDFDDDTDVGVEGTLKFELFSVKRNMRELKNMMGYLRAALDRHNLEVEGVRTVNMRYLNSQSMRDTDPKILHGITEFQIIAYAEASEDW